VSRTRRRAVIGAVVTALVAAVLAIALSIGRRTAGADPTAPPALPATAQTSWAPPGTPPLSDARAAELVVHRAENRAANAPYNDYVPSDAQLRAFHEAREPNGELADDAVPEWRYVTGRPGLKDPSTDDLIQWAAHKWGIPEDWVRAQIAVETWWRQSAVGDRASVLSSWYAQYPVRAQIPASSDVYQSMGISQVKWRPDGSDDVPGSEPLRGRSTAFALDIYAAKIRFFYNGDCTWCSPGYAPGQQWNSIGGWYEPTPWGNAEQQDYVQRVQAALRDRVWLRPGF
jgi:hypothetical protein